MEIHNTVDAPLHCEHLECSATFRTKRALAEHIVEVHVKKKFLCKICRTDFGKKSELQRHLASVHTVNVQNEAETYSVNVGMCSFTCKD